MIDAVGLGRRGKLERAHDPLLVGHDEQEDDQRGAEQPVDDDQDPEDEVGDRQGGGVRLGRVISNINKLFIDIRQVWHR